MTGTTPPSSHGKRHWRRLPRPAAACSSEPERWRCAISPQHCASRRPRGPPQARGGHIERAAGYRRAAR
jgi:hypothetical protein